MKKNYTKPQIVFDNFELSQSIAGSCEAISNQVQFVCPVEIPELGFSVFNEGTCDYYAPDINDYVCYDGPPSSSQVFSS